MAALLALTAAGAATACGSERVAGPAPAPLLDPTAALNAMSAATRFGVAAGAGAGALGVAIPGVTTSAGVSALNAFRNCQFQAAQQAVVCPAQSIGGYTLGLTYAALDAAGNVLSAPTPATAEAVRTVLTVQGTTTLSPAAGQTLTVTLAQRQEATLRGFLSGTRVLDAVVTSTSQYQSAGGAAGSFSGTATFTQTTAGLALPAAGGFPTAGTITTELSTGASAAPFVRQVLTFTGGSTASLVVTLANGTAQRCTLDLAAVVSSTASALRCAAS